MAQYDDINTPMVALVGFLGSILVFAIVVFLSVLYVSAQEQQEYAKNVAQPYTELENLRSAQRIKLVEYRWVDQAKHVVAIPIDRAMQLVVDEYRSENRSAPQGGQPAGKGGRHE